MREGGGKEIDGGRVMVRRRKDTVEDRKREREKGKLSSCFFPPFFSDERDWRVDRRGAPNFGTPFDNIYRRQCESSVIGLRLPPPIPSR